MPGRPASPAAEAALQSQIGRVIETDDCIDAVPAGGDLVLPGIRMGRSCRYDDATAQGGRMRLKAHCGDAAKGVETDFAADGRYTSSTMETTAETATTTREAGYLVRMTIGIRSHRTGECPAR
jgi:hypothetical protein